MRSIIDAAIWQDDQIRKKTSAYINDLYMNKGVTSITSIADHLLHYGKTPDWPKDGVWILGLAVWRGDVVLFWKHWNEFPDVQETITRKSAFSLYRKLIGHLCVCIWLQVAAAIIKWRTSMVAKGILDWQCPSKKDADGNCQQSEADQCKSKDCVDSEELHMGWCKFLGHGYPAWIVWYCHQGCVVADTRIKFMAHQPRSNGCNCKGGWT